MNDVTEALDKRQAGVDRMLAMTKSFCHDSIENSSLLNACETIGEMRSPWLHEQHRLAYYAGWEACEKHNAIQVPE